MIHRHWGFALLLLSGLTVRALVFRAYPPAFAYYDDSRHYLRAALTTTPHDMRPFGYSAFLKILSITGRTSVISLAQLLIGLGLAVVVYAVALRRGLPRWLALVAAAPVLLDARQIIIEHYILSDALFSALVLSAVAVLLWRDRPTPARCAAAGLLGAAAMLTRSVGAVPLAILLLYPVIRRLGWRPVLAFALAAVVPLAAYPVWYHQNHGVFAYTEWSGRFLWSRTTAFVDCSRRDFTEVERRICPPDPVGSRDAPDNYVWSYDRDRLASRYPGDANDPLFGTFARKAIMGQPSDYAWTVVTDTLRMINPGWRPSARAQCVMNRWRLPSGVAPCGPELEAPGFYDTRLDGLAGRTATPVNTALEAYGRVIVLPLSVLLGLGVFALLTVVWRPRRRAGDALDAGVLATIGLGVTVAAVATSCIDPRYALPAYPLVPLAAALAWHRLRATAEPPVVSGPPARVPRDRADVCGVRHTRSGVFNADSSGPPDAP